MKRGSTPTTNEVRLSAPREGDLV